MNALASLRLRNVRAIALTLAGCVVLGGAKFAVTACRSTPTVSTDSPTVVSPSPRGRNEAEFLADVTGEYPVRNAAAHHVTADVPDPTSRAINARLIAGLQKAVQAQNPRDREAIYSRVLAEEVERFCGDAEGTVRSLARDSAQAALRLAMQFWAARDFPAAYTWALQIEAPDLRPQALASVLYQSQVRAPQATLELAQSAPLGELREVVLQNLALQWSRDDRVAATAWAMAQPVTSSRDGIFQQLADACADNAPADAAHLVAFGISPGAAQDEAVARILQRWARDDFGTAVAWVQRLPAGTLRRRADLELQAIVSRPR